MQETNFISRHYARLVVVEEDKAVMRILTSDNVRKMRDKYFTANGSKYCIGELSMLLFMM